MDAELELYASIDDDPDDAAPDAAPGNGSEHLRQMGELLDAVERSIGRQDVLSWSVSRRAYQRLIAVRPRCWICDEPPPPGTSLHVDHCHRTGRIRGLLCAQCNAGLGFFRDRPELMTLAAKYLRRTEGF